MADITKIRLESGDYDIKDATAREDIVNLQNHFNQESFNHINPVQAFIYQQSGVKSFQGCCVDDNNLLYQYEHTSGANGNLHIFNLTTRTLSNTVSNVPFYHGNSLTYDNGYLYVATVYQSNESSPNNSIIKYNLSNGTYETLTPFASTFMAKSIAVCMYDDKLMVMGAIAAGSVQLGGMTVGLVDGDSYTAYSILNPKHFNITNNVVCEMEVVGDNLYVLTDSHKMIVELLIDNENHTLTVNNIVTISDTDNIGLTLGELEGFSKIPSGYYGEDTLVITSICIDNTSNQTSSLRTCLVNLHSDVPPLLNEISNAYYPRKVNDLYVNQNGGTNLSENGSASFPFKSLSRAIEYYNVMQSKGFTISTIHVTDTGTYHIGNLANTKAHITFDSTGTIHIGDLYNCDIAIETNNSVDINKENGKNNVYMSHTKFYLRNAVVKTPFYASKDCSFTSHYMSINCSSLDWMTLDNSRAMLNISSYTGITRNLVNNRFSSICLINSDMSNKVYTDTNSYKIVGTA